ncbi:MAG: beta-1,3-glucanase family protein [Deltaproteobacteria bacterium]|nr:beta-1,3-glucanase family protein [Deltaproteobacteria bacterium]
MKRLAISLILALLSSFLLNVPVLAAPSAIKLNIINHSGYPDNQVYLVFYGQAHSDTGPNAGNVRRLDWQTGNFTTISTNDNSPNDINGTAFSQYGAIPDTYANYSTTLSALPRDANGHRYFNLPTITDSPPGFASGRLYISFQRPVYLHINGPQAYTQPGYTLTATDVNAILQTKFDFFEPALDPDFKVWADTTNVDAVGMPLLYELKNGNTSLGTKGLAQPMSQLRGAFLRDPVLKGLVTPAMIIAPGHGIQNSLFPSNYLDNYIAYAWPVWTSTNPLTINYDTVKWSGYVINTQLVLTGNVNTSSGSVSETHYIHYPSTSDVFFCQNTLGGDTSLKGINYDPNTKLDAFNRDADLKNNVGAALNRAVFHLNPYPTGHGSDNFPWFAYRDGYNGMIFYGQNGVPAGQFATNIYSKLLHQLCYDGVNIYGFAYDDNCNISTTISGYGDTINLTIGNYLPSSTGALDLLLLD